MWPFNRLKLFWKIFIWFWLAMAVMAVVSVLSFLIFRDAINYYPAERNMVGTAERVARILESDMFERRKRRAILGILSPMAPPKPTIDKWKDRGYQPYYLIDDNQRARSNIELPQIVKVFLQQEKIENRVAVQGNIAIIGGPKITLDGKQYRLLISNYIGRFKGRMIVHFFASITLMQWLIYLIMSSSLCFLLAHTIVKPIKALRHTTQALRKGEHLSAVDAIGDRKDEFYDLANDFDAMATTTHKTIEAQKQLLSDVSHELRSPLTRIQIALGLLEKLSIESTKKHLTQITKDAESMERMIAQLLNIAALERGQIIEQKDTFSLPVLLTELYKTLSYEAAAQNVNLKLDIEQVKDDHFVGYYQLLCSAVENIIRNAIRHCETNKSVTIQLSRISNGYQIVVEDEGDGVEDEFLSQLFEPFFRTDSARARHTGGVGLGLTIASRAVKAHGGSIKAENRRASNEELKGFRVIIELPLN